MSALPDIRLLLYSYQILYNLAYQEDLHLSAAIETPPPLVDHDLNSPEMRLQLATARKTI